MIINNKKKLTVITAIFGDYDILHSQPIDTNINYICITDNVNQDNCKMWNLITDNDIQKDWDPRKKAYYVRYNINKYINTPYCLWLDASTKLSSENISYLYSKMNMKYSFWGLNFLDLNTFLYNGWLHDIHADELLNINYNSYKTILDYCKNKNVDTRKDILIFMGFIKLFNINDSLLMSLLNKSFNEICLGNNIILYDEPIFSIALNLYYKDKSKISFDIRNNNYLKTKYNHEILKYMHKSNDLWLYKICW
jgi:hypothetical protein